MTTVVPGANTARPTFHTGGVLMLRSNDSDR